MDLTRINEVIVEQYSEYGQGYKLVRHIRHANRTLRVSVLVDAYEYQSHARVEVLNRETLEWTRFLEHDPDVWFKSAPRYAIKDRDEKYAAADRVAADAFSIAAQIIDCVS